jgi:hypothetical protein
MKKYFSSILFIFLAFQTFQVFAQSGGIPANEGISNTWLMNEVNSRNALNAYKSIAGNPYLNLHFKKGTLVSKNNTRFTNVPLRYNVYTDNIEYKSPENKIYNLNHPTRDEFYQIGDTTFIYSPFYKKNKKLGSGYFQLLESGKKAKALLRYSVYIKPFEQAKPYTPEKPTRFSGKIETFYVKIGSHPAQPVYGKKSLLNLFPDQKSKLLQFIKKEHINTQKEAGFVKIIAYYNSL